MAGKISKTGEHGLEDACLASGLQGFVRGSQFAEVAHRVWSVDGFHKTYGQLDTTNKPMLLTVAVEVLGRSEPRIKRQASVFQYACGVYLVLLS